MPQTISEPTSSSSVTTAKVEVQQELDSIRRRLIANYDNNADQYDADRSLHQGLDFYFQLSYRTINQLIGPVPDDAVHVDMPVGTGRFFVYLREHGRRHQMIGIDNSPGMLKVCRAKIGHYRDSIQLLPGDAFQLPLDDDSVDVLTCLRLFHLYPQDYWPRIIGELRRVVRPGGMLITEMRNAIRGRSCILAVRGFRERRKRHPHTFVAPHQVGGFFKDWSDVRTEGIGFDGSVHIARIAPRVFGGLRMFERYTPLRYLSKVLLIKAIKPSAT